MHSLNIIFIESPWFHMTSVNHINNHLPTSDRRRADVGPTDKKRSARPRRPTSARRRRPSSRRRRPNVTPTSARPLLPTSDRRRADWQKGVGPTSTPNVGPTSASVIALTSTRRHADVGPNHLVVSRTNVGSTSVIIAAKLLLPSSKQFDPRVIIVTLESIWF